MNNDLVTSLIERGVDLQKLNTLKALQAILAEVQNIRHYTYARSEQSGYYDFYLNGKFHSRLKMIDNGMADYMIDTFENGFIDGVAFTATETFKTLK